MRRTRSDVVRRVLAAAAAGGAVLAWLGGCAERRIRITSEPAGAEVSLNDVDVGATPCEVDFTYFGVYDVRVRKPGFEPLRTTAEAKAPFHEWPFVDLAAAAVPVRKKTLIEWHFVLEPAATDRQGLLDRAAELATQLPAAPRAVEAPAAPGPDAGEGADAGAAGE
ncbi:MAG: PEGA domain-containing protein [Planctomycetota bacterium]|nr:PEGA domain-containing protein [Planctomycetota bacterium]